MSQRRRAYEIIEASTSKDKASTAFDIAVISLIFINIIAFVLETVDSIRESMPLVFEYVELISVGVFTVEYLLRIWTAVEADGYERPLSGRLRYCLRPMMLIDLLAILPAFLPFLGVDLRAFRALRMFRLARIAKLGRYTLALKVIQRVFVYKKEELVTTLAFLTLLLLFASSVLYLAEHEAQPEAFGNIPRAMWWGVATLTTVGYGDVYPVTIAGKILGAAIAILGIGMFALPTGILGAAFVEEVQKNKEPGERCPHCGRGGGGEEGGA